MMIWEAIKILFLIGLAIFAYKAAKAEKRKRELEAAGVVFLPYFPFVTDTLRVIYYAKKYSTDVAFTRLFEEHYDVMPEKMGFMVFGMVCVIFNKAEHLDQVYVTKNSVYTKHEIERKAGKPLLNLSMLSLDSDDPSYKMKRKALSGAFFKSKLGKIAQIVKQTAMKSFYELQQGGNVNTTDLNSFTSQTQSHIIVNILLGAGYSFQTIPYVNLKTGETSQRTLAAIFNNIMEDLMLRFTKNPLLALHPKIYKMQLTSAEKAFYANCLELRGFVKNVIKDRKQNKMEDASDVLSLLLTDESYQNEEDIVDDMIIMFLAGSKTVQNTTSNLITSLLNEPEIEKKFKAEVYPFMEKCKDNIMQKMTLEEIEKLEYTRMCYQETMRRDAPAVLSKTSTVLKPTSLNGVNFQPGDPFYVGIVWVQNDPEQFHSPSSFIPERFDPESKYNKRPNGQKRSPFAFSPFLGGSRICLGKTFAEITLKFTLPLYYHFFDFELVKEEHKKVRPIVKLGSAAPIDIPMKFITRNKVPSPEEVEASM